MGGTIEAFRDAAMGRPVHLMSWAVSLQVALVILLIALITFSRSERRFADVI